VLFHVIPDVFPHLPEVSMLTKRAILAAIRSAARKLGHAPTRAEFTRLTGIHHCRLIPHFPGYRAAIRAAGLSPHPGGVRIETGAMLKDWGRLVRRKGRVPTRAEYDREGRFASASLETRFHRWSQVPAAFVEFVGSAGLAGQWSDVFEKIRTGPMPARGGGRHWLKQRTGGAPKPVRPRETASDQPNQRSLAAASAVLPPPVRGKRCVTWTMIAVLVDPRSALAAFVPRRVYPDRPLLGPPTGLPALAHEPVNEMGVALLFGMVAHPLGFIVESVQMGFPDCEAKLEVEPGRWQRVRIEFEYESRQFRGHHHNPRQCDMIVCWRHNWKNCPPGLQVLELSAVVRALSPSIY
jgi:hypothetical protein